MKSVLTRQGRAADANPGLHLCLSCHLLTQMGRERTPRASRPAFTLSLSPTCQRPRNKSDNTSVYQALCYLL